MGVHKPVMLGKEEPGICLLCSPSRNPAKHWISVKPSNFKGLQEFRIMGRLQPFLNANHKLILKILWVNFPGALCRILWDTVFAFHIILFYLNQMSICYSVVSYLLLNFVRWVFCPLEMCRNLHEGSVRVNTSRTRSHTFLFRRFSAVSLWEKVLLLSHTGVKALSAPSQQVVSAGTELYCCYFLESVVFKLWKVYSSAWQWQINSGKWEAATPVAEPPR